MRSMCGAYGYISKKGELEDRFRLEQTIYAEEPRYNIRPTKRALVITNQERRVAEEKQFGITPAWNPKIVLINSQGETIDQKPSFKKAFLERRCLIPASFFFEWQKTEDGKQPFLFRLKDDSLFAFAGIYTDDGFAIVTTEPNDIMKPIHNRMPVILQKDMEEEWLNPDADPEKLKSLLKPFPDNEMEHYAVSTLVNKAGNDFPEVTKPLNH